MIKTVCLTYYAPMRHFKIFRQYVADNGKSLYTINDCIVTKETGNQDFLDSIKNSRSHEVKRTVIEADNDKILNTLNKGIDQYVEYIDDYRQYKEACAHNNKIRAIIEAFEAVMENA